MAGQRLPKEYADLKKMSCKYLRNLDLQKDNMQIWVATILPEKAPYDKGAFRVEITFPSEYPFKPPTVVFKTKIYHPNVDEKGLVCLPIISPDNWKPSIKVEQVFESLVALINDPEPEHPLRSDVAEEMIKDRKKFLKKAEEFTKQHAEKRA